MKVLFFGTLLLCTAAVALGASARQTGYLIDKQCIQSCESAEKDASCAPDGINVFYYPHQHTGKCLLMPSCVASGYVLVSEAPANETDGRHSILLSLEGDASQAAVVSYIEAGTRGPFPRVTVLYDDNGDGATEQGEDSPSLLVVYNATLVDPWTNTSHWKTTETRHTLCTDGTLPDIQANNFCYRSDVTVTDRPGEIIIESNGCPDHPNMMGSNGTIPYYSGSDYGCGYCNSNSNSTTGCCTSCGACSCSCNSCGAGKESLRKKC